MTIKQALIVDDSKSARVVLKRMLVELALNVDTVETAVDALDYLENHKPDVIFMDHMMPGMDGFEAVKHIKTDPHTAVIPIMMYTSRGGDVYLSQARALGAVGIIPKTISPVGLKESLFNLGLIDERRINERRIVSELETDEGIAGNAGSPAIKERHLTNSDRSTFLDELERLMDEQTVELHKSMWLGVESVSHEIFNRLNSEREKQLEEAQQASPVKNKTAWPFYIVSALLVISIAFNFRLLSDYSQLEKNFISTSIIHTFTHDESSAEANLADKQDGLMAAEENLADRQALLLELDALMEFIVWADKMVIEYPFNELALNEKRIANMETLVNKALESKYSGNIILQTHVGRFCMSRDPIGNYELADDNLSIAQCDYIGNNLQPDDAPSTHQSLSFANYLSEINSLNKKTLAVEVANISRSLEASKYPDTSSKTKVKEWNLAARLNNHITVKLEPAPIESEPGPANTN